MTVTIPRDRGCGALVEEDGEIVRGG